MFLRGFLLSSGLELMLNPTVNKLSNCLVNIGLSFSYYKNISNVFNFRSETRLEL